jgi:hypothetical protein
VDGQRASGNPVLTEQFDVDKTICLGERQKAALSGVTVASGGLAAGLAAQDRTNSADAVARGCMAEKGYLLVPAEQADSKQAELAAVAEQKKQQDAAASAAPSKPVRKPVSSTPPSAKPAS